jgi:hypothetical protein
MVAACFDTLYLWITSSHCQGKKDYKELILSSKD